MARVIVALILVSLWSARQIAAQPPETTPPAPRDTRPPIGTARIQGRVIAADSKRPLRRVRLTLTAPSLGGENRTTSTDEEGRYELADLPAGRYNLAVSRSGYLTLRYGQSRPFEQGKPLDVAEGQSLGRVDFALPRSSMISGRLTDELGEPIANVAVYAMRVMYYNGRRQLTPTDGGVRTDDGGEYRIGGLVPATYAVLAKSQEKWTVDAAPGGVEEMRGYAPTYFPGTADPVEARRVTVGVGEEASAVDFALVPGRAAKISGTALNSRGEPMASVMLAHQTLGPNGGSTGIAGNAPVAADGTFTIAHVSPGEYRLMAAGSDEAAALQIVVDGIDIASVSLTTSPGWSVRGNVTTESGDPPAMPRSRVRVLPNVVGQRIGMSLPGMPSMRDVQSDDWTFIVTGILGPVRLGATLPQGWMIRAVLRDGQDLADRPLEGRSGEEVAGIQVVITNRLAKLRGRITNDQGAAVADGTVIVFAKDAAKWHEGSRFVRAGRPDQDGQYEIDGLLPGDYLAVAVDYVEQGTWNDPEYLETLRVHARQLRLPEGDTGSISLQLVIP